jgi:hypothetical protein
VPATYSPSNPKWQLLFLSVLTTLVVSAAHRVDHEDFCSGSRKESQGTIKLLLALDSLQHLNREPAETPGSGEGWPALS